MKIPTPTENDAQLMLALTALPLRKLATITGIGKNRLHRLRTWPGDARLWELHRLHTGGMLRLVVSRQAGQAS